MSKDLEIGDDPGLSGWAQYVQKDPKGARKLRVGMTTEAEERKGLRERYWPVWEEYSSLKLLRYWL